MVLPIIAIAGLLCGLMVFLQIFISLKVRAMNRAKASATPFITPEKVPSTHGDDVFDMNPPQQEEFQSTWEAISGTVSTAAALAGNDQQTSREAIVPNSLIIDLHEYFEMDSFDVQLAGKFLLSLGCKHLHEVGMLEVADIRAEAQTAAHKPPALIRSKIIEACKILRNGGDLEELRLIGKQKRGSNLVTIRVGEQQFTTNRSTLCRVKGSFLESLLSGRHSHPAQRSESGEYFIDRSAKFFPFILEYLRYGSILALPMQEGERQALALEADFYGLEDLSKAVRGPKVCTAMFLSEKTLQVQANEQALRMKLISNEYIDPMEGLIPLFNEEERGEYNCPIRFDRAIDDDVNILFRSKQTHGIVTVSDQSTFVSAFNRRHANVLHRIEQILREEPVVIAGGSVLCALRGHRSAHPSKDVDLFICTTDKAEATRISERLWKTLAVDNERWAIVRSPGVINMHLWEGDTVIETVQIVLRLYSSVAEVLFGFDCDCCCCAYNGREVLLTPRCYRAFQRMANIVNPLHAWPNRPSYELRLAKYALRGFRVAVPGLDMNRVDPKIYTKDFTSLQGLARLLRISFELERNRYIVEEPYRISEIREPALAELDPVHRLIMGENGFYDETPAEVFVPSVFCGGEPMGLQWLPEIGGEISDFPPASVVRDPAWDEIVIFDEDLDIDNVPNRLADAWSDASMSREFLNSKMDKDEVDNMYYMGCYKEASALKPTLPSDDGV